MTSIEPGQMGAAPTAVWMQGALQRYLDRRGAGLRVVACETISGGYETFIFGIRFEAAAGANTLAPFLPTDRRLILRVYQGVNVVGRSGWEAATIAYVRGKGVVAPELHLYEADPEPLGAPFLVIGFVPGERLDQAALTAKPLTVLKLLRNYARAQTALHALEWPEGPALLAAATPDEFHALSWAPDRVQAARRELEVRGLTALLPVVDWLEANRGVLAAEPEVFVHGDFHPLNMFVQGTRISGIIDWGSSGFANRHEDIGWSSMLIATVSAVDKKEDRRLAPFRAMAHKIYLGCLWQARRLDRKQLRYGEVSAALRWLLIFLPSYLPNAGPPVLNPDAAALTTPLYVERVRRFIEKRTKLKIDIA